MTFQNNVPSCTDGLFTSWMMLVKMMSPIRQNASIKTGARAATSDPSHNVCMLSNICGPAEFVFHTGFIRHFYPSI